MPAHRWELPNGLIVLVREDPRAPLVAMEAVVKTGSATEGALAGTGVSHVVEHLLFKGTATRPVGAIERAITAYGGQINGHTTHDSTGYTLTVHRDYFQEALALLADALQHPSFDAEEVTREREVVLRELKLRRDDPEQYTADLVWHAGYQAHPYRLPVIGYEPLVKALTQPQIVEYYRTHYLPNRTVLAIVGDVRAEAVRAAVDAAFAGWPRGVEPDLTTPVEPPPVAPRVVEETAEVALAQVVLAFPSVALTHPDLAALDTLAHVLGEGRGSRLDLGLREQGLAHDVASWNYTPRDPGLFAVSLRLDPERIPDAVQAAWDVIRQVHAHPVAAAELAAAQRAVVAQEVFSRQTVGAQAGDLATSEALVGDPEFSTHYVARVQQVTAEDLLRVARQYLDPARAIQVTVRPRKRDGSAPVPFLAEVPERPMELITLANGVRVLIREDRRLPIVSLRVTTLGGLLAETLPTNGVSTLTARMLLRGTASRSAQELTELVRSLGGSLSSAGGRNSVAASFELLSQDVVTGVEVLNDVWHHPAFPADEFLKEQRLLLAEIAQAEDDLFAWGGRRLNQALFPDHPYGWSPIGTAERVGRLTVSDVAACHRRLGDPRQTVVTVFGDCRAAQLLPVLERTFGRAAPTDQPLPPRPASAPLTARRVVEGSWPRAEAIVLIGFRGTTVTAPDAVAVEVLDMVLGGPAGRLFTEVRDRRGQAYTVGMSAAHGVDPGSLVLYAVTAPDQVEAVVAAALQEVDRVRAALVTPEELAVAQRGLIGTQSIRWQTNSALSLQVGLDALYQVGWSAYRDYPAKVQAVTAEQVRQAAQRYLTPNACIVFIGRPRAGARGLSPQGTIPANVVSQEAR